MSHLILGFLSIFKCRLFSVDFKHRDFSLQIWDLRAGKMMTEFLDHGGPVYDVEFHPHEFLLASASADKTVNFWDLESFNLVSKSEKDSGPVRY